MEIRMGCLIFKQIKISGRDNTAQKHKKRPHKCRRLLLKIFIYELMLSYLVN